MKKIRPTAFPFILVWFLRFSALLLSHVCSISIVTVFDPKRCGKKMRVFDMHLPFGIYLNVEGNWHDSGLNDDQDGNDDDYDDNQHIYVYIIFSYNFSINLRKHAQMLTHLHPSVKKRICHMTSRTSEIRSFFICSQQEFYYVHYASNRSVCCLFARCQYQMAAFEHSIYLQHENCGSSKCMATSNNI